MAKSLAQMHTAMKYGSWDSYPHYSETRIQALTLIFMLEALSHGLVFQ